MEAGSAELALVLITVVDDVVTVYSSLLVMVNRCGLVVLNASLEMNSKMKMEISMTLIDIFAYATNIYAAKNNKGESVTDEHSKSSDEVNGCILIDVYHQMYMLCVCM